MKNSELYEVFHSGKKVQRKVINDGNFTYGFTISLLNRYVKPSSSILDIGCGVGTILLYLASKGCCVTGIDISLKAITSSKKSACEIGIKTAKFLVKNFPHEIPKGSFDLILCLEVLEHLTNDNLALEKIYTMLSKKGTLVISVPSKNAPLFRLGLAKEFDKKVGHLRRYTLEELETKTRKLGFKSIASFKTEGIIRNFLFLNPVAGKFVRFIKFFLIDIVTFIDNVSLRLFGESDIFLILQKK